MKDNSTMNIVSFYDFCFVHIAFNLRAPEEQQLRYRTRINFGRALRQFSAVAEEIRKISGRFYK